MANPTPDALLIAAATIYAGYAGAQSGRTQSKGYRETLMRWAIEHARELALIVQEGGGRG
jgi:hypothetical protein